MTPHQPGLDLCIYPQIVSNHEVDRMLYHISLPASSEQMDHLGIWFLRVANRRIISSFQYPQVPSRWVVSVSGTCKYGADGPFHHLSTRKYRADGSSRYLVLASTEPTDHFIIPVPASTEQMGRLGTWYLRVPNRWIISSF